MKIAFIGGSYENLGLQYLSAVLKEHNHQTMLFIDPQIFNDESFTFLKLSKFFNNHDFLVNQVATFEPDIIGFSVFSDFYLWASDLAKIIKQKLPKTPIIFGGIHPTSVPEYVIQNAFVDMVCVGEGEYPLLELAESMSRGEIDYSIKNIWFKKNGEIIKNPVRPLIESLDGLPIPDKELFYDCKKFFRIEYFTMTGRGCFYSCSYCYNSVIKELYKGKGTYLRKRSVSNLLNELEFYSKKFQFKYIRFFDDTFTTDKDWLGEFSEQYPRKIKKSFLCYARPDDLDEYKISLLKKAGCAEVEIGIQTWNENTRRVMLNRFVSNQKILESIKLLKKADIKVTTDNILGIPGQSEEELINLVDFHNSNRVSRIHVLWLRYYPKTPIVDIAKKIGALEAGDIEKLNLGIVISPYTQGGSTYRKELAKFQTLFAFLPLLPRGMVTFILNHRLYRFLFVVPPFITRIFTNIFESKSKFDYIMRKRDFCRYVTSLGEYLKVKLLELVIIKNARSIL